MNRNSAASIVAGAVMTLVSAFYLASIVAWAVLGLSFSRLDPLALPGVWWGYRHDPSVQHVFLPLLALFALLIGGMAFWMLRPKRSLYGDAHWANEAATRKAGLRGSSGVVLGSKGGKLLRYNEPGHVLIEAPTRSGKGVGIVIPTLLTWTDSALVLDVKRENWEKTAGFRAQYQDVYLFNPLAIPGATACYNPLGHIDTSDPASVIADLQQVAVMLFEAPSDSDKAFWTELARNAFVSIGGLVASKGTTFSIGAIQRVVERGNLADWLKQEAKRLPPVYAQGVLAFAEQPPATFGSTMANLTSRLALWKNPNVANATDTSNFDLADLRSRRMTIYLGVNPADLDLVAPLFNLIAQQLVARNTSELKVKGEQFQVLLLLDEFARLGKASVIASGFSYMAGYGVKIMPIIQSRTQLRAVYGPDVATEILTNCSVEVAFTPSELKVAEEISERIGFIGQKSVTHSLTMHGMLANRSKSTSLQRRALMLPHEILQFPASDLIVFVDGSPPILGRKLRYYSDSDFMKRVLPAPVPRSLGTIDKPDDVAGANFDPVGGPAPKGDAAESTSASSAEMDTTASTEPSTPFVGEADVIRRVAVSTEKCDNATLALLTRGRVNPVDAQAIKEMENG